MTGPGRGGGAGRPEGAGQTGGAGGAATAPGRRGVLLAVAALAVPVLGACSSGPPDQSPAEQDRVVAGLRAAVSALPGVASATVRYTRHQALEPARLTIRCLPAPGRQAADLVDPITRVAWTSTLRPVESFELYVGDDPAGFRDRGGVWTAPATVEQLTRRYGPRPTG